MLIKILHIILITIFFFGCECIPAIDTPKEIKPENGSKIAFFHLSHESGNVSLLNKQIVLLDNITFSEHTPDYKEAFSGYTNFKIQDNSSGQTLYNGTYNFEKAGHYSMFFYDCKRTKVKQVRDSVYSGAGFVRIVNMYDAMPFFEINYSDELSNLQLKCGDLTELYEISSSTSLEIKDDSGMTIWNQNLEFIPNTIQNVIILHDKISSNFQIQKYNLKF